MTPSTTSASSGRRNSRRSRTSCRRGVDHSAASATKETTSTVAAAAANSDLGIGRSARPTRPWAKTGAGSSTRVQSKNDDGPAEAGPSILQELLPTGYLHLAVEVPAALGFGGWLGFGAKVSFAPKTCFLVLQPT